MSYILEALADSEQAREQFAATPRYSLLPVVNEEAAPGRRWPYLLAGALLVNAAVLQVWLRSSVPGEPASMQQPLAPQLAPRTAASAEPAGESPTHAVKPASPAADSVPPAADAAQSSAQLAYNWRVARPVVPAEALPKSAQPNAANDNSAKPRPKSPSKPPAARSADPVVSAGAGPAPVPAQSPAQAQTASRTQVAASAAAAGAMAELPPALQRELPALSVAGFIRNEGADSMVIVNDRLVREGEEVAAGVTLEKILNDGLVFSYKGYRFKR